MARIDFDYTTLRGNPENAIRFIREQGGWVIRTGDPTMTPLEPWVSLTAEDERLQVKFKSCSPIANVRLMTIDDGRTGHTSCVGIDPSVIYHRRDRGVR